MEKTLTFLFRIGPLLFGIAILAPFVAQFMTRMDMTAPLGLTTLEFGLTVGIILGIIATIRGRWL